MSASSCGFDSHLRHHLNSCSHRADRGPLSGERPFAPPAPPNGFPAADSVFGSDTDDVWQKSRWQVPEYPISPERLRKLWRAWEEMPYPTEQHPPGSLEDIHRVGVDLALLDGDLGGRLHLYFDRGEFNPSDTALPYMLADLRRAIPHLEGHGRVYFELGLVLLEQIIASRSTPSTGSPNRLSHLLRRFGLH